jgi:hypothetical protein
MLLIQMMGGIFYAGIFYDVMGGIFYDVVVLF